MEITAFDRRAIPSDAQARRWAAPDGWDLRVFDWPAEGGSPRGSILFQAGRGDVFEKYLETFAHWHCQGWTVTSFDWRGQGGSGRCTDHPHCGHVDSFDDFISDLTAFHAEWRQANPGPHVAMGHSMGGHLVLRALAEGAIEPDAAVLIAPMLGLKSALGAGLAERAAKLLGNIGNSARPAWKGNERPHATETRETLLTHDRRRYDDELWWQQSDTSLLTGPPSWRWVIEAFKSTRELRRDPRLKTMRVPVLGIVANADKLVDAKSAVATINRLPDSRVLRFGDESAHEILREVDRVRDRALAEIDEFLSARAQRR